MGREQRPGDWAAWMTGGPASPPARELAVPASVAVRPPVPAADPASASVEPGVPAVAASAGPDRQAAASPEPDGPAAASTEPDGPAAASTEPDGPAEPDVPLAAASAEPDVPLAAASAEPDVPLAAASAEPDAALCPDPAEPHRSARREATRQRILDASREVFAEIGVGGATVEDICDRAGFTRGAFYSNFADKPAVIEALVEREQNRLLEMLDTRVAEIEEEVAAAFDLPAVLRAIVDRILVAVPLDRELSLVNAELENLAIRQPDLGAGFLAINGRFRQHIAAFLAEVMDRNGRDLLVDPAILTEAFIGVTQRSVRRALLDGPDTDPNEVASQILPGLILAFSRPRAGTAAS